MNASRSCFVPNGMPHITGVPCNASAEQSSCCAGADVCLSNGLCFSARESDGPNVVIRSSCTDPTFRHPNCPQICQDVNPDQSSWVVPVYTYSNSPFIAAYCCGQFNTNNDGLCDQPTQNSALPFPFSSGNLITNRSTGDQASLNEVQCEQHNNISNTMATIQSTATAAGPRNLHASTCKEAISHVVIGVSTGVPLGVLLILACFLLGWQVRRRRVVERENTQRHGQLDGNINRRVSLQSI